MSSTEIALSKSQALAELNRKLEALAKAANDLVVKIGDPGSYTAAAGLRTSLKAVEDAVKFQTGPRVAAAKEELERAKQEEATFLGPAKTILAIVDGKMTAYREEEKRQAKIEQDRKNAELRRQAQLKAEQDRIDAEKQATAFRKQQTDEINAKLKAGEIGKREAARLLKLAGAGEEAAKQEAAAREEEAKNAPPQIEVRPAVPVVAGAPRNQTYYFAEVTDENAIVREFVNATKPERRGFLRQFIQVNEAAVSKFARDIKDSAKAASLLPGVKFSSRG